MLCLSDIQFMELLPFSTYRVAIYIEISEQINSDIEMIFSCKIFIFVPKCSMKTSSKHKVIMVDALKLAQYFKKQIPLGIPPFILLLLLLLLFQHAQLGTYVQVLVKARIFLFKIIIS